MATIILPPELERAMAEQARRQGTTLELLALDKLNAYFLPTLPTDSTSQGETMADFLKDFVLLEIASVETDRIDVLMTQYRRMKNVRKEAKDRGAQH